MLQENKRFCKKNVSGRKNSFTDPQLAEILALKKKLDTTVYDGDTEIIFIKNYTQQIPLRAFGVVENPSWADFEQFLEDRCFPRTRDHNKECLRELGVPFYDPLLIIEKTDGYMAGDHQWILTVKKKEEGTYIKYSGNSLCRI